MRIRPWPELCSSRSVMCILVCTTAVLENHIKPAVKAAGIGVTVGWHTFRHSYSSMLRQLGVDLRAQQGLPRHTDVRTTMNVYTQAVSEQKRAAHSSVVRMVRA